MNFNYMSDEQILEFIAKNLELTRVSKQISSEDMAKKGGYNSQTYSNFVNRGTNIKAVTLIQIFRGLGVLDKLQNATEFKEPFSPSKKEKTLPKRVFAKKTTAIKWGEDL